MNMLIGAALIVASVALVWLARARNGQRVTWLASAQAEVGIGMLFTGGFMLGFILLMIGFVS